MSYAFIDGNSEFVQCPGGAVIRWNAEAGGPDGGGAAWRQWEQDGSPAPLAYVPPPLVIDDYRRAIQAHVDATARARNYDSGITCASYVDSTHPVWAAEARAFVPWRDAVWTHAYTELAKVEAGEREQPTVAQIIDELPAINWPLG